MIHKKPFLLLGGIAIVAMLVIALFSAGRAVPAMAQVNATVTPTEAPNVSVVPQTGFQAGVLADFQDQLTQLYAHVSPSVVSIDILGTPSSVGFSQGFPGQGQGQQGNIVPLGAGSGVVWDNQGYIITNNHVVENAQQLVVNFNDGTSAQATVVGTDPASDLAVVKVDVAASQLHPIQKGSMDNVHVGNLAIALGNPFGLQGSMSVGIVSALNRSVPAQQNPTTGAAYSIPAVIQTDAPINPGNSGGALVNINGELIGVPESIESTSGSGSGVGFAIPISLVNRVVPALIENGQFQHPYLGIQGTKLTAGIAQQMGLPKTQAGALVVDVAPDSPAAQAGITGGSQNITMNGTQIPVGGDVITAINGTNVTGMDDLINYLTFKANVGDTVTLTILRNGQTQQVPVTLAARPSVPQTGQFGQGQGQGQTNPSSGVVLGVQVAPVDQSIMQQYNLPAGTQGLFVAAVMPGSPAAQAGMQSVDVITAFNGKDVTSLADLRAQLSQIQPGDTATITVLRNGQTKQLTVTFSQGTQGQSQPNAPFATATPISPVASFATATPSGSGTPFATEIPYTPYQPLATATPFPQPTSPGAPGGATGSRSLLGFNATLVTSNADATALGLPNGTRGIYVNGIAQGSIAAQNDLQNGDVITQVNDEPVTSLQDLVIAAQESLSGKTTNLTVLRNGNTMQIPLNIGF